jgi:hypothetical protein
MISRLQRLAQSCDSAIEIIHHPRKDDRNLKPENRPDLFNMKVGAMKWLQEAAGAHALVQQTHTRLGFDKPPKDKHADLGIRGVIKGKSEVGIWLLRREYNDFGDPVGYRRVTGIDQLSPDERGTLECIPFDKPMGFTELWKHIWEDEKVAAKKKPYYAEFLRHAVDAKVLVLSGIQGTVSRKYTRPKEAK